MKKLLKQKQLPKMMQVVINERLESVEPSESSEPESEPESDDGKMDYQRVLHM